MYKYSIELASLDTDHKLEFQSFVCTVLYNTPIIYHHYCLLPKRDLILEFCNGMFARERERKQVLTKKERGKKERVHRLTTPRIVRHVAARHEEVVYVAQHQSSHSIIKSTHLDNFPKNNFCPMPRLP